MTEESGEKHAADFAAFLRDRVGDQPEHEIPTAPASGVMSPDAPARIGPYKILAKIGEGGMGVVYLAEQTEPVRRRVAMKIIKTGMDTKAVVARFEAERHALALMDHPCVARVLDAGATEAGRPYFVMEHVAGVAITEHCDRDRLSVEDRLRLFMKVCDAVQHAHQKGVIHRDLKPSNILVSVKGGREVPKVIDFGVAKALHQRLTEQTLFTAQGQFVGTPAYMSPEQAEMTAQDIDTRSDIYSLGVLLYELLTGERPFSSDTLDKAGMAEVQRIIREEEPPKPSIRLDSLPGETSATHARSRQADPKTLRQCLKGDLDWIVMKCLEKDRARRYETANGLAADLRRHLAHEPVRAGPPSTRYRIGKFVRRNRLAVSAVIAIAVVLVAGIVGTTGGWLSAVEARAAEAQRAYELQQVTEFQATQLHHMDVEDMGVRMREDLLSAARVVLDRPGLGDEARPNEDDLESLLAEMDLTGVAVKTLERSIFDRTMEAIDEQFLDQELVRARLLQALAQTLAEIGLPGKAEAPQTEALRIRRSVLGKDDADTLTSVNNMASLLLSLREPEAAEEYCKEALEGSSRVLGPDDPLTLTAMNNMGVLLQLRGDLDEAEEQHRKTLRARRRVLGPKHPDTLISLNSIAGLLRARGELEEAEQYYRDVLDTRRDDLGADHRDTLTSMHDLGLLLQRRNKFEEAVKLLRGALEGRRQVLSHEHPQTLHAAHSLAWLLHQQEKFAEAEGYYQEALDGFRRVLGREHPNTLICLSSLGALLNELGRYEDSEPLLREAVSLTERVLGADHWRTAEAQSLLGEALTGLGRYDEAEPLLIDGFDGLDAARLSSERRAQKLPEAIERIVQLYEKLGDEQRADEWRKRLEPNE